MRNAGEETDRGMKGFLRSGLEHERTPIDSMLEPKELLDANEAPWLCGFVPQDQGLKSCRGEANDIPGLRYSRVPPECQSPFITVIILSP